jgi:hypothetical protein
MATLHQRAARGYASLNLPCCPIIGKAPRYAGGHGWHDATADTADLERLFTERDHTGVGIACGPRGWVLDIDGAPGRRSLISLIQQHGDLPRGPLCQTGGGGFHFWFRWDERCIALRNSVSFAPGLDLRVVGGGVVAPPSIHPDTQRRYEWRVGRSPYDLEFPTAPQWLLDAITSTYPTQPAPLAPSDTPLVVMADRYAEAAIRSAADKIRNARDGQQRRTLNAEAVSIGWWIVGAGLCSLDDAAARLVAAGLEMTNHRKDRWTAKTVETVVRSGLEYGKGKANAA